MRRKLATAMVSPSLVSVTSNHRPSHCLSALMDTRTGCGTLSPSSTERRMADSRKAFRAAANFRRAARATDIAVNCA
jgi:hypothetical protein